MTTVAITLATLAGVALVAAVMAAIGAFIVAAFSH